MKLQTRFFTSYLIITILLLIIVGGYTSFYVKKKKFQSLSESFAAQLVEIDFALSSFLQGVEEDVEFLARLSLVRTRDDKHFTNFLEADETTFVYQIGEVEQRIRKLFAMYKDTHFYANSVYMGRENGGFVRSHKRTKPTRYDPRTRPWYQLAVDNPEYVMRTAPYPSVTTDDINIGIVRALTDNNTLFGVIGVDITLHGLTTVLSRIQTKLGSSLLLLDEEGIILSHPEREKRFTPYPSDTFQQIVVQESGYLTIRNQKEAAYNFFYTSQALQWTICAVVPIDIVNQEIQQYVWTITAILLIVLFFSGVQIYYLARSITNPIQILLAGFDKLVTRLTDRQSFERITVASIDEFSTLANAFNVMGEQLFAAHHELDNYSKTLEQKVTQRTRELTCNNEQLEKEITERRQIEDELRKAKDAAEVSNRAKSEFLANMSHEFRTPLNGVLGYAQILKREQGITTSQQRGLDIIERNGNHLLHLVNDILDLSKIEARRMEIDESSFLLLTFLNNIAEIVQIQAQQKGLTFYFLPSPDLPQGIRTDEKRLKQILLNLLSNAVKFTQQGKVILRVSRKQKADRIHEGIPAADNQLPTADLSFEVEDTGIGISPGQHEQIFSAFQQAGAHPHTTDGTGLGLTISRQLVQLMGGILQVRSTPGQGSLFWFDLELTEIAKQDIVVQQEQPRINGIKGEAKNILIIDDNLDNRTVLISLLEPLGFHIMEAVDGQDGVEKAATYQPDLIFMDLIMPVMDGFEATRRIRKLPSLAETKIIAVSASTSLSSEKIRQKLACDDCLVKPLQIQKVLDVVATQLDLEWTYAPPLSSSIVKAYESSHTVQPFASSVLVVPPISDLHTLKRYALDGNFQQLQKYLTVVERKDRQYAQFCQKIRRFIDVFDDEGIDNFLGHYLGE